MVTSTTVWKLCFWWGIAQVTLYEVYPWVTVLGFYCGCKCQKNDETVLGVEHCKAHRLP